VYTYVLRRRALRVLYNHWWATLLMSITKRPARSVRVRVVQQGTYLRRAQYTHAARSGSQAADGSTPGSTAPLASVRPSVSSFSVISSQHIAALMASATRQSLSSGDARSRSGR